MNDKGVQEALQLNTTPRPVNVQFSPKGCITYQNISLLHCGEMMSDYSYIRMDVIRHCVGNINVAVECHCWCHK